MAQMYYAWLLNCRIQDFLWVAAIGVSIVIYTTIIKTHAAYKKAGSFDGSDLALAIISSLFYVALTTVVGVLIVFTLPYTIVVLISLLFIHICVSGLTKGKNPLKTMAELLYMFKTK